MTMADWAAGVVKRHEEAVRRGEHDERCEWRAGGFFLCDCRKRARLAQGFTQVPTEPLYFPLPDCPRCNREVDHDGDSFRCYPCHLMWNTDGTRAEFDDENGDLAADVAKWEATRLGGRS